MKRWLPTICGLKIIGCSTYLHFLTNEGLWIIGICLGIIITIVTFPPRKRKPSVASGKEETKW